MMMTKFSLLGIFGITTLWLIAQTLNGYFKLHFSERLIRRGTLCFGLLLLLCNLLIYFQFRQTGTPTTLLLPDWLNLKGYRFLSILFIDEFGTTFALFSSFIFLFIAKFSFAYLHKDEGFFRYFILITTLAAGIQLVSYAGSLDILFMGWEVIGITSIHLISYFHANTRSVQNSFRTLIFYRICDVAFLSACVLLHYYDHGTDFHTLHYHADESISHWIGLFLILASLAKSAQVPFSSWFFRAMEGPTTSSAIYYGALSVHLGPFLLIRTLPLWSHSLPLKALIFAIGACSALYASTVGRTRSDVKSSLAYAAITQVGFIYMELALGLTHLAILHLVSHGLLRCWQFLRSASIIHDFLYTPITKRDFNSILKQRERPSGRFSHLRKKLYIHALNGFYLDHLQDRYIAQPFKKASSFFFSIRSYLYFLTPLTLGVILAKHPLSNNHTLIWVTLLCSFLFSIMAFSAKLNQTLLLIVLSQGLMSLSGLALGELAQQIAVIQLLTLVVIAPTFYILARRISRIQASHPELTQGISKLYPYLSIALLLMGWLAVGAPGSPICISEDLLFYQLVEISPWTTIFFSLCSFTNFVVFYYQFSRVFYGNHDPYRLAGHPETIAHSDLNRKEYLILGLLITVTIFFGLYPSLLIR